MTELRVCLHWPTSEECATRARIRVFITLLCREILIVIDRICSHMCVMVMGICVHNFKDMLVCTVLVVHFVTRCKVEGFGVC